ncbi:MAG: 3-hydroxyacyl-CoA dehydrogenase/enoyl-CoA hydratase family protein [Chloroflexi bacterium]|nr:3-hydroxyacyl-CoA dehydrogenase/enoyl-CoA hydratase family protein [Chloroflexota bacterium]
MQQTIRRVAVIGAGTMGAAIAGHLANAGIPVYLLDIPPSSLTPKEEARGLTLDHPEVRNRIVREGFERMRKARPANLFNEDAAKLITLGNTEDHFHWVGEADWIIEAIIERLDIKQALMERIDGVRKAGSIVSSNTSGLPIKAIGQGRSDDFRAHFLGTHFFNPPRYMKLLEVIPTADTDPAVVEFITQFAEEVLGKGVVIANDTPNFIANRLGFITAAKTMEYAIAHGYSIPEVDLLTGPLIGRPKTGTFRLADLVGIDVLAYVANNLYELLPDDPEREALKAPAFTHIIQGMLERNWLGNKTKIGFSKQVRENGKKAYWQLNFETFEHEAMPKPRFDSVGALRTKPLPERLKGMVEADDRAGEFVWYVISRLLHYAAAIMPEVSDDPLAVDNAMKWGFQWEVGPFEIWDILGVEKTLKRMEAEGLSIAPWVKEMLESGAKTFHRTYRRKKQRWVIGQGYVNVKPDPKMIVLSEWKQDGRRVIATNASASLVDIGDDVLLLEFHAATPQGRVLNALDLDVLSMTQEAIERVEREFAGLVIGNQGEQFSVGANIFLIAVNAQQGNWDTLDALARQLQGMRKAFTQCSKPVVAAPFGMTLGGGAEVCMAADRIVAAAETYMGLPEVGVGIIPAGGGTKEMVRRVISPAARIDHPGIEKYVQEVALTIATAKIATSAAEARDLGFLAACDRIVMNRDHLIAEAKAEVLAMAATGYRPQFTAKNCYAAGRDALATLRVYIYLQKEAGYISEHDAKVAEKVAYVVCGGELSRPQWVDEDYFLDLEREALLSLAGEPLTQARLWHMLQTGKPLRN